ncbi:hypothetical protein B0H14DRAFT_3514010 [Mycena olivaceomarginata]|nr:hypothetical protein B0H14DRAFT_3514010 [Mycena olivaceomarginata]
MDPMLTPASMTAEEMIPDVRDPERDSRFWCLPPVRDMPSEGKGGRDRFPMYLVSQGRRVGVWHNWTVVKAMVSGHPSGAQRGHQTIEGCIAEWQQHCLLGVHPHPAEPQRPVEAQRAAAPAAGRRPTSAPATPRRTAIMETPGPSKTRGRRVEGALQADLQEFCMPKLAGLSLEAPVKAEMVPDADNASLVSGSTSISSTSSVTASTWAAVPDVARYFALWGGCIVYSDRGAFLEAEAQGSKPKILSTANYDEAQAFSESVYWLS